MTTTTDIQSGTRTASLEQQSLAVLQRVRAAFLTLIEAVPGPTDRAADLERALGLNTKLAWQMYRVAHSTNPLAATEQVPGAAGMRQVFKAATKAGVPQERVKAVHDAIEAFENLVRAHAGDRATFARMASSIASGGEDLLDLRLRRSAFRENSLIWGVRAKTTLWSGLWHPGPHDRAMHASALFGFKDWRCIRPDVTPKGIRTKIGVNPRERLNEDEGGDGSKEAAGPPQHVGPVLLQEFSTRPLPVVDRRALADGFEEIKLLPQTLGNAGAMSFFLYEAVLNDSWKREGPEEPQAVVRLGCSTPSEVAIVDFLVYADMFGPISPKAAVFDGRAPAPNEYELLKRTRLPMTVTADRLGRGPDALQTADVSHYPEMVSRVCEDLGWDPELFDVYRCRIEYPIMSSIAAIWFPLPKKGNW